MIKHLVLDFHLRVSPIIFLFLTTVYGSFKLVHIVVAGETILSIYDVVIVHLDCASCIDMQRLLVIKYHVV